jgi:hypothetical protein
MHPSRPLQEVSWWLQECFRVDDVRLKPSGELPHRWMILEDQFSGPEPPATNQGEAFSTPKDPGDLGYWVHLRSPSPECVGDADDHEDRGTNGE